MAAITTSETILYLEQAVHDLRELAYHLSGVRGDDVVNTQLLRMAAIESTLRERAAWYLDNDDVARLVLGRDKVETDY